MNKYFELLHNIYRSENIQNNKKGTILYCLNQQLSLDYYDIETIFKEYKVPQKLLLSELHLYMQGKTSVEDYNNVGISWWNYCAPTLVNSYPTYYSKLLPLINKINLEKKSSKNYVLFVGETLAESSQLPCISLIQFQISDYRLYTTVYQRSADCNLGLPCDIFQIFHISRMINVPFGNITFFIGNAHIYLNNKEATINLLSGKPYKFILNV